MPNKCQKIAFPTQKSAKEKTENIMLILSLKIRDIGCFSGRLIGSSLNPNSYPAKQGYSIASELAKQVYHFIVSNEYSITKPLSTLEHFDSLIANKLAEPLSRSYRKTLSQLSNILQQELIKKGHIRSSFVESIPLKYDNNTSYNTVRRHLNVLVNYLNSRDFPIELSRLKTRKQKEVLHRPINNIQELLDSIKEFNTNLYLCCLLTYGCLLRPHQEIRLLRWRDFSDDLSHINLMGSKVKSCRNRIVPVPSYIKDIISDGLPNLNIFSGSPKPYNKSCFSLICSGV